MSFIRIVGTRRFAVIAAFAALCSAPAFSDEGDPKPQKPAQQKDSVTFTLPVELRGVLAFKKGNEAIVKVKTTQLGNFGLSKEVEETWVLDLGTNEQLAKKARQFDGKPVVVTGTCRLRGLKTESFLTMTGGGGFPEFPQKARQTAGHRYLLDVDHNVRVVDVVAQD